MKNREKYAEEIKNYKENNFCQDFIEPVVLKACGIKCPPTNCDQCRMIQILWLDEEYTEPLPEIDWSNVKVDTPILVSDNNKDWYKEHFAKYEDGKVFVFLNGKTSWTSSGNHIGWKYAKLAEE